MRPSALVPLRFAPRLSLVVWLLWMLAAADASANRGPAFSGHQPASAQSASEALIHSLREAVRCERLRLRHGAAARCRPAPPPTRFAMLQDDLLALAYGADRLARSPAPGIELRAQRWCQQAIARAVTDYASLLLREAERGRRRPPLQAPSTALRPIERFCKLAVRARPDGGSLPAVGAQCSAAVGEPGAWVDPALLRGCLQQLVSLWIDRARHSGRALRPNIVVIVSDDQRYDSIDATHSLGDRPAMPAVFDRLAEEGVVFRNAYVTDPVCAPSRASLLTGRNVFRHGTLRNTGSQGPIFFDDSSTLATWLQQAGYQTGFVGKYTNAYSGRIDPATQRPITPPGWDDWRAFNHSSSVPYFTFSMQENGEIVDYGPDAEVYATDVLRDHALRFIADAATSDRPFLLYLSTSAPHYPWNPAPRHQNKLGALPFWMPPNYFEEDVSDKPHFVQAQPPITLLSHLGAQLLRRGQLEMMFAVDELVDALLTQLAQLGIDDDTMLVYTSDNGHGWGEHRWKSKGCPWEECLRVPLIVRYPRLAPLTRSEDRLVLNLDLAPTLAELAGVTPEREPDGRSLLHVLDGSERVWRDDFLIESYSALSFSGVHEGRFKLVEHLGGERELYDLEADPWELENLAGDPAQAVRIEELTRRLHELWPGWAALPL